jgi:cytochrome c
MDLRNNTIFGWVLGAIIVALGLTSLTGIYFRGHDEGVGYEVAGGGDGGGGADDVPFETYLAQADAAAGEQLFSRCAACHTINAGGANGNGPNLHGIVGLPIGSHAAGFNYSPALSGHGGEWTFANLNDWLAAPRRFANGTTMSFAGLSDPQDRANLIAYLNAQGSNLPLPTAPAADAAPAEGDAAAAPAEGEAAAPAAVPAP